MTVVKKWQNQYSLGYSDMMSTSKHCSSIYFRCKTTVMIVFTFLLTVMLLTDLSTPDDKSIGIKYCQKIRVKVLPIPISILRTKSIADTYANTPNVSPIGLQLVTIQILRH